MSPGLRRVNEFTERESMEGEGRGLGAETGGVFR